MSLIWFISYIFVFFSFEVSLNVGRIIFFLIGIMIFFIEFIVLLIVSRIGIVFFEVYFFSLIFGCFFWLREIRSWVRCFFVFEFWGVYIYFLVI